MFTVGTRRQCLLVGVLLVLTSVSFPAFAEKRFALLIGNEAYESAIGRLGNPHNDVALLEQALKGLGFEVAVEQDNGLGALTRAVNAYVRRLHDAGSNAVGFFYYSGHGASDGSTNYLIPVDVKTTETGELWDQSLQLTEITRKLKKDAPNATHFVVFDACRNTLKLTQPGSRALVQAKGFVPVAQESGMLIAYSTAENELASDVGVGAGPYAKVLAEEIVKPGIEAVSMFRVVQRRVRIAISQEPYLGFNALGDVYLGVKPGATSQPAPPQTPSGAPTYEQQAELTFWLTIKDSKDPAVLQVYLDKYPSGMFADLARKLIAQTKRESEARRAEAAERAAQVQRAEAERKARDAEAAKENDQLRKALEEARLAREALKTAEADRLAAEKAAQEARRSAEAAAPKPTPNASSTSWRSPDELRENLYRTIMSRFESWHFTHWVKTNIPIPYHSMPHPKAMVVCIDWANSTPVQVNQNMWAFAAGGRGQCTGLTPQGCGRHVLRECEERGKCETRAQKCLVVDINGKNAITLERGWLGQLSR